jgi:hypothetical protein
MKIQNIKLKHFKKFRDQELDFTDPETGLARNNSMMGVVRNKVIFCEGGT